MNLTDLLKSWTDTPAASRAVLEYRVQLPLEAAARLEALGALYPALSREQIITDLVAVALEGVAAALPYRAGTRVIALDDHGDPVYEDVGPTPRFIALTREHLERLTAELARAAR